MSTDLATPFAPEPYSKWGPADLMQVVRESCGNSMDEKDLENFRNLRVPVVIFLDHEFPQYLQRHGFGENSTFMLMKLVNRFQATLAPTVEKRAGSLLQHLSPEDEGGNNRQNEIRKNLEIIVGNLKKLTDEEPGRNNIVIKPDLYTGTNFLTHSSPNWPKHVQKFHDILIAPASYPADTQDKYMLESIEELKRRLGNEAFDAQFTSTSPGTMGMTARQLSTYTSAVIEVDEGFCYHDEFSAVAKEINLAGLVVDPAIKHLGKAYNRDKPRTKILVAGRDTPWCPSSDFAVAYGTDPYMYSLLLGETDSGEPEQEAMYKNALLSCYSWKLYRSLTKHEDHVIVSAYISSETSSLYMFYKDGEKFVVECILKISDMFRNKDHVVQFLRRMHNFAANIQWKRRPGDVWSYPRVGSLLISSHQEQTNQTGLQKPASTTRESSGARDPLNTIRDSDLANTGFKYHGMLKYEHIAVVTDLDSGGKWIAKKIWDKRELHIINFLLAAKSMNYGNHTITVKAEFTLDNDRALLVMPQYVDLSVFTRLDQSTYYDLRFQLIEGVAFMHEQGVTHRDLKPSNIVVESRAKPHGKLFIIDYGLARQIAAGDVCVGYRGTRGWTAPEVRDEAKWDAMPADVWSMGKVILGLAKLAGCDHNDMEPALSGEPSLRPTAAQLHIEAYRALSSKLCHNHVPPEGSHRPFLKRQFSELT